MPKSRLTMSLWPDIPRSIKQPDKPTSPALVRWCDRLGTKLMSTMGAVFSDRVPVYTPNPNQRSNQQLNQHPNPLDTPAMTPNTYVKLDRHQGPARPRAVGTWVVALQMRANIEPDAFAGVYALLNEEWQPEQGARCVIDLQDVDYLGSILLGLLINIRTKVKGVGGTVVLAGLPVRLIHIVRTASLDRLFELYSSRDDALASF